MTALVVEIAATDVALNSRARVMTAARAACKRFGVDFSWADDLAQEVAAMQCAGEKVRLDRRGLDWLMNTMLKKWLSSRVKTETVDAFVKQTTSPPSSPIVFAELQQIYRIASHAQRQAIMSLMLDGHNTFGDMGRRQQQRRGQALYALRQKIGARP